MCVKNAFFVHFLKFCVFIFWNACFCSVKAFGGCARFSARFLSHEQFGGNLVHFLFFSGSCFCLSQLFVCFFLVVVACFVLVCVVVVFCVLLLVLLLLLFLLLFSFYVFMLLFSCCCFFSCCFLVVVVLICPRAPSQNNILKTLFFHGLLPFSLPPSFSSFCFFPSFLFSLPSLASKSKKQKKKGSTRKKEMKREIRGQNG